MKPIHWTPWGAALILSAAMTTIGAERETPIAIDDVPTAVLEAVAAAVPGITFTEAEMEQTDEGLRYEIEGSAGDKEYEIVVSADGKVLGVEIDDEDEEGEEEQDDDGDDDGNDHDHADHAATHSAATESE